MSCEVDNVNTMSETPPVPDPGRDPRRSRDLRQVLVDAAVELVEAAGARGLSWREVARSADVSHSAAYRHFEDREGLLAAVAEHGFRDLAARMGAETARSPAGAAHRLEAMAIAYVEFAAERPSHFRVMFGRDVPDIGRHPSLRDSHDAAIDLFRSAVTDVLNDVGAAAAGIDADRFALMGWSLVHGLASLIVDGRVGDLADASVTPAEHVRSMTGLVQMLLMRAGADGPPVSETGDEARNHV